MKRIAFVLCVVFLLGFSSSVFAHDADITQDFLDMATITVEHQDDDPWKGYVNVTVQNSSDTAWGDFHFQIMECGTGEDVSNVDIVEAVAPLTSQFPYTYAIDNDAYGAKLDYYFYDDPVVPGSLATFTFYTDNTTDNVWFCLSMCPSAVPEPAVLSLLCVGLSTLVMLRRRK
jgi:hypothetical protein